MQLNLYMRQACTEALGPGKRYALWVQGCRRRCRGCLSPDSRSFGKGEWMDTGALAREILQVGGIEGLTISGGEPFLQAKALCELLAFVKGRADYGIIVYTGCTYEELQADPDISVQKLLSFTDILVDGEYVESLNDGKSLRGSSNQRALFLTGRYKEYQGMYGAQGRNVELYIRDGRIRLVGIPSMDVLGRLGIQRDEEGGCT